MPSSWRWNEKTERYHDLETGRFLSYENVNRLVDQAIDGLMVETSNLARAVAAGDITVDVWHGQMRQLIKTAYIWNAEVAAGGRGNMTPQYWGAVGGRIYGQYRYLDDFAAQLPGLSEGQIARRSRMYINSSRQVYWRIRTWKARDKGYTEEKWEAIGDDATCNPCLLAGHEGWRPIGTYAEPGSGSVHADGSDACEGLTNCRCIKVFR